MAMNATLQGTGIFGLVNETGLVTDAIDFDATPEIKELMSEGAYHSVAQWGENKISGSISGTLSTGDAFAAVAAAEITLINSIPDIIAGTTTAMTVIITSVKVSLSQEDFTKGTIDFNAYNFPA